ncbi:hypothetical protein D5W64_13365 [Salmonella enterica subsp. enterica serovar Saintpaul]|nr:hypothetical protein [Salmonella enterica subsp. enterica serovar Saintpaul]
MEFETGKEILKSAIVYGLSEVFPSNKEVLPEFELPTACGLLRFKTRPTSPDHVTVIYLDDRRLYKVMTDCCQSREPVAFNRSVKEKLARDSFDSQCRKLLS